MSPEWKKVQSPMTATTCRRSPGGSPRSMPWATPRLAPMQRQVSSADERRQRRERVAADVAGDDDAARS